MNNTTFSYQYVVNVMLMFFSRSTGKQIRSLIGSIYKAESTATGIEFLLKTYSSLIILLIVWQDVSAYKRYHTSFDDLLLFYMTLALMAPGLMDRLRTIPTRQSLELRAEVSSRALRILHCHHLDFKLSHALFTFQVASMASDLKNQRCVLQERINKISEYGVRV